MVVVVVLHFMFCHIGLKVWCLNFFNSIDSPVVGLRSRAFYIVLHFLKLVVKSDVFNVQEKTEK